MSLLTIERDHMKRTSLMITTLCMTLLYCVPAMAEQHTGPYVGGYVGGNYLPTADSTDNKGSFNISYKTALQWGAAIGWELGPDNRLGGGTGRVELEYSRRSNDIDSIDFKEGSFSGSGKMISDSVLFNCIYVHHNNTIWSPYLGVGAGVAFLKADDLRVTGRSISNDSTTEFAYQVGTGVEVALGGNVSLDIAYRFFGTLQPEFTETDGRTFKTDYFSHSALLGVRYGF